MNISLSLYHSIFDAKEKLLYVCLRCCNARIEEIISSYYKETVTQTTFNTALFDTSKWAIPQLHIFTN